MKTIIFVLSVLIYAMSSAENLIKYSFDKFKSVSLGIDSPELVKILGDPSSKENLKVANENFIVWQYSLLL